MHRAYNSVEAWSVRSLLISTLMLAVACSSRPPTSPELSREGVHAKAEDRFTQPARPAARVVAPRPALTAVPPGAWGGDHVGLTLSAAGGTLEYDCAHGTIDQAFVVDSDGRFALDGTHTREHGGPIRSEEKPEKLPARYTGTVVGDEMTLTVTLTSSNAVVGTFTLTRGRLARVFKCA